MNDIVANVSSQKTARLKSGLTLKKITIITINYYKHKST